MQTLAGPGEVPPVDATWDACFLDDLPASLIRCEADVNPLPATVLRGNWG